MAKPKLYSKNPGQFLYLGRWVNKDTFRTFVYNGKDQKLANTYKEYEALISSGTWFNTHELALEKIASKAEAPKQEAPKPVLKAVDDAPKVRKLKDGANS